MADRTTETTVLVLTGEDGEFYAIPQEDLEKYRVTDEQRAEIEQQWGEDVSGYSMYQSYLSEQAVSQKHAELRHRGEEIRHKADFANMANDEGVDAGSTANKSDDMQGVRRFFSGVLATLHLSSPRPAKTP